MALLCVSLAEKDWGMGNGGEGGYFVPFVSGLALCCFLACHARQRNRGQQMWLLGGEVVQVILLVFSVMFLHVRV